MENFPALFAAVKESSWEYLDSVVFPDRASDRVGAVLYCDNANDTTGVMFFDAAGKPLGCQTEAKTADNPEFTYLGNGTVTFKLEAPDGTVYQYELTFSLVDGEVHYKAAETELEK